MTQPDDLHRFDAQQAAQERGDRIPPYVGALVRILYRPPSEYKRWFSREIHVLRVEGYLGVVTRYDPEGNDVCPYRVEFADEYLYLAEDEFEVLRLQHELREGGRG